jgi:hypothetical protein
VAGGEPKAILSPGGRSQGSARRPYPALAAASAVSSPSGSRTAETGPEAVLSHARAVACPWAEKETLGGAGSARRVLDGREGSGVGDLRRAGASSAAANVSSRYGRLKSLWTVQAHKEGAEMNNERLAEVLRSAADAIEGLYEQLKREPPLEGADLIAALRALSKEAKSN